MEDNKNEIEFIQQPLLTDEGFINQACLNEIESKIKNSPKTFERLQDDKEWTEKKWTTRKAIVGAFAKWACKQSPYGVPDNLEVVCKYLYHSLNSVYNWDVEGMGEVSLCDINKWLYEILYEQGVSAFDLWNVCKKGKTPEIKFTCRYDNEIDPDYDFISLDALLHNVCLEIRDERRTNEEFCKKFEMSNKCKGLNYE